MAAYIEPKANYLLNKSNQEYRQGIFQALKVAEAGYKKRLEMRDASANPEETKKAVMEAENVAKKTTAKVSDIEPAQVISLDTFANKQKCAKHGTGCSSKLLYRWFRFDSATKRFQYSVEKNGEIKKDKEMDLMSSIMTAQSKETAPKETWEGEDADKKYRLEMKFKQRNNNPIYFYTDDKLILDKYVGYVQYSTMASNKPVEEIKIRFERMLAIIHYVYLIKYYNTSVELYNTIKTRSKQTALLTNLATCAKQARNHYEITIRAWGRKWIRKAYRNWLKTNIRLSSLIRTIQGKQFEQDQIIIENKRKISAQYKKHEEGMNIFEKSRRGALQEKMEKGLPAHAVYFVNTEAVDVMYGKKPIDKEAAEYTKMNFSGEPGVFKDHMAKIQKDRVSVVELEQGGLEGGITTKEVLVGDISSIVNNQPPNPAGNVTQTVIKNTQWICINGRKINKGSALSDMMKSVPGAEVVDPVNKFLCQCPESYLGQKSLIEMKIFTLTINDISAPSKYFKDEQVKFCILIKVGDRFFTRTIFKDAVSTGKSHSCRISTGFSLKIDPENSKDNIEISVQAASVKAGADASDDYYSYKRWYKMGFCKIPLDIIINHLSKSASEQIPMCNGVYASQMAESNAMVNMSFEFKKAVHGNAPEVLYSGTPISVGEQVTYRQKEVLNYPRFELDYKRLNRPDLGSYNPSMIGKPGCPLRSPINSEEWLNSGLPGVFQPNPAMEEMMKPIKYKIPHMFVMPSSKEEFVEKRYPGVYEELSSIKRPGDLVDYLESFESRTLCKLLSIDSKDNCTLILAEQAENIANATKITKHVSEIEAISDVGVSLFEAPSYVPPELQADKADSVEWKLWLGFKTKEDKEEFLVQLRQKIRDHFYQRRLDSRAGKTLAANKTDPPITGNLFITVVEAKNLSLMRGSRVSSLNPFVRITYRKPTKLKELVNMEDIFGYEDEYVEKCEESLSKLYDSRQAAGLNPNWRTSEQPYGEAIDCGKVANIFKKNIILDISICCRLSQAGPEVEELGHAELPLSELLDPFHPVKYYWLLLKGNYQEKLPLLKIWTLFYPSPCTEEDFNLKPLTNDVAIEFTNQLIKEAETTISSGSAGRIISWGDYNPNYMRPEQFFVDQLINTVKKNYEDERIKEVLKQYIKPQAVFEFWEYKMIRAYRYFKQKAKAKINESMQMTLWDNYLLQLLLNETIDKGKGGATAGAAAKDPGLPRGALASFDRLRLWQQHSSWKYSELVALCKRGIPKDLRPRLWSELFGISKSGEFEEKIKLFELYVDTSLKTDSVVYEQMEHDIREMRHLIENVVVSDPDLASSTGRPENVLKVAKAYNAWCVEENRKNQNRGVIKGYFKGLLHFIHKILQVFPESEAFCSLLGFSTSMPLVFNVDSVMTGKVIWGQKFIIHAIRIILEKRYKKLFNSIMSHGLPLEYYIADKISTLLSTVYLDETLMKIYDCMALETASYDSKRAMWILVSGCLMLFTLNEAYLISARTSEEVLHIINNTGHTFLNSEDIVEKIYYQAHDLFTVYNPFLSSLWTMITGDTSSAVGLENEWGKRSKEIELKYENLKKMNKDMVELVKEMEIVSKAEEEKKSFYSLPSLKSDWIIPYIDNLTKYYKDNIAAGAPGYVQLLLVDIKDSNLKEGDTASVNVEYGGKENHFNSSGSLLAEGWKLTQRVFKFGGNDIASKLTIYIGTSKNDKWMCVIDLNEFQRGFPLTIDLPLIPESGRNDANLRAPLSPQPFITIVLYIKNRDYEAQQGFDKVQKAMNEGSLIIIPEKRLHTDEGWTKTMNEGKREWEAIAKQTGEDSGVIGPAKIGPSKVFKMTGSMEYIGDPLNSADALNEETAVKYLFSMRYNIPEEQIKKMYKVYSSYYKGRFPIKRFIISLIALSNLSVNRKLTLFYQLLNAISGANNYTLAIDDIIELISILYEIHLCNIPPEQIPHMVEEAMVEGGNSRITAAYLCGANRSGPYIFEMIRKMDVTMQENPEVLIVTEEVKSAFKEYCELWGKKLIINSGKMCLFGNLVKALGGNYMRRPGVPGPYMLIICYRHKGHQYYREFRYTVGGELVRNDFGGEDPLLISNSYNLNFIGYRLPLSVDEFITRFQKLPLLSDLMRMHLTLNGVDNQKTACGLEVDILCGDKRIAEISFSPKVAEEEAKMLRESVRVTPGINMDMRYQEQSGILRIQRPVVHTQDLLLEIRGEVMLAIEGTLSQMMVDNRSLPVAFDLSRNPNLVWHFYSRETKLDEYSRLSSIPRDLKRLTLKSVVKDKQEERKKDAFEAENLYMLHVHGDYTMEWLKCTEGFKERDTYAVKTKRFDKVTFVRTKKSLLRPSKYY